MANANKIKSQDVDWSASSSYGAGKYLGFDGIWSTPSTTSPSFKNTVFVSKNGSDSTGAVETLGLPFLTIAAARLAAIAYYDGSSGTRPLLSATQRVLIVVFPGVYNEAININTGATGGYIDYDLTTAIIDLNAGAAYTIDDNNTSSNCVIYGNAQILRSTAGTLGCIRTQNASTTLTVKADYINTSTGKSIVCTNGSQTIYARLINSSGPTAAGSILSCAAGTQTVFSKITNNSSGSDVIYCSGGTQLINGNISNLPSGGYIAACDGGSQTINGDVSSVSYLAQVTAGTQIINGNCTISAGGNGIDILYSIGGIQTINGNIDIVSSNSKGIKSIGGTQIVNGNITLTGGGTANLISNTSGTQIINGDLTSDVSKVVLCAGGVARIKGRITTTGADAVSRTSGTLILDNCSLFAATNCITAGNTVKIYGTCQANVAIGAGVVQQVGSIIVDTNVT